MSFFLFVFFVYSYSGAFLPCLAPNAPTILKKILIVGQNLVILYKICWSW